jgi:hypothetical protein
LPSRLGNSRQQQRRAHTHFFIATNAVEAGGLRGIRFCRRQIISFVSDQTQPGQRQPAIGAQRFEFTGIGQYLLIELLRLIELSLRQVRARQHIGRSERAVGILTDAAQHLSIHDRALRGIDFTRQQLLDADGQQTDPALVHIIFRE